jgi:hypothetical protein
MVSRAETERVWVLKKVLKIQSVPGAIEKPGERCLTGSPASFYVGLSLRGRRLGSLGAFVECG